MEIDPRALTDDEGRVLGLLLDRDFPGAAELRQQLAEIRVVGVCDCGCPTIYLAVGPNAVASPSLHRLAPIGAIVIDANGEPAGELLVFLADGKLEALEYAWFSEPKPTAMPSVDMVRFSNGRG